MSCPICEKKTDHSYRPFCSKRCADIDLGRWMTESYALPIEEETVWSDGPAEARRDPEASPDLRGPTAPARPRRPLN